MCGATPATSTPGRNWAPQAGAIATCCPITGAWRHAHGGQAGWRGADGPLHVTRGRMENPLYKRFIEAGEEAGYAATEDYNGERQEGFGAMEMTVWRGRRWSAANAYLKPALQRRNLRLKTTRPRAPRDHRAGAGHRRRVRGGRRGPPRSAPGVRSSSPPRPSIRRSSSCSPASVRAITCGSTTSRSSRTGRAWAPTCRTISRFISR